MLIKTFEKNGSNYLLLASTGVVTQNVRGKTIHSELCITFTNKSFYTCTLTDKELKSHLMKITILIIDEISMVFGKLLDFISNIFVSFYNNKIAFGKINVILVSDLFQLPPVTGQSIFYAVI